MTASKPRSEIRISSSPNFETNLLVDSRYIEEDPFVDVSLAVFDLSNDEYYVRMSSGNALVKVLGQR